MKSSASRRSTKPKTNREDRILRILARLAAGDTLRLKALAQEYGVSQAQIREDLNFLQDARVPLERPHGAAKLSRSEDAERDLLANRRARQGDTKRLLAAFAVDYAVSDNDNLFLDGGTTMEAFVQHLAQARRSLRIVTAADGFAQYFRRDNTSVYVQLGGALDAHAMAFLDGPPAFSTAQFFLEKAQEFLNSFCQVNFKVVMSGTAFSMDHGLSGGTLQVVTLKRTFISLAKEVIILLDHTKFSADAKETITYCGLKPDPWLTCEKPARIIVDAHEAFGAFSKTKKIKEINFTENRHDLEDYRGKVRVFQTTILPGPGSSSRQRSVH